VEDLKIILRNGKYLSSLVNDFLDLSKIETGRLFIQKTKMSPRLEIEDSILVVKSALELKNLGLKVKYLTEIPEFIDCDPTRFRQVLINLLSNAVKFTDSGNIEISILYTEANSKASLIIRIADTGIGMSQNTSEHLFTPFLRGESKEVQRVPGSGLGLALSRSLARQMGGELKLVRTEREHGSEFEFSLELEPIETVALPASQKIPSKTSSLKGIEVLAVDDSEDLRILMKRILGQEGAIVTVCRNGAEAVELANQKVFDIILMDMKMPIMDGYQATTELRKKGYARPIVALTAHASNDDRQLCYQAGCDDYLSKPVDRGQLLAVISRYAGAHGIRIGPVNQTALG
jgi:CheY-like chemotaxis protein